MPHLQESFLGGYEVALPVCLHPAVAGAAIRRVRVAVIAWDFLTPRIAGFVLGLPCGVCGVKVHELAVAALVHADAADAFADEADLEVGGFRYLLALFALPFFD